MRKRLIVMRKTILPAIILFLVSSCSSRISIVKNHEPEFYILAGKNSDSLTIKAAQKLNFYLEKISGARLQLLDEPKAEGRAIIIGMNSVPDTLTKKEISGLSDQGFIIKADKDEIILAGKTGLSDLFAVSTFLEEWLGCMKFTGSEEYIPVNKNISISKGNKKIEPAFAFRHPHFSDRQNPDFLAWHKLNSFDNWGLFVHTFQKLCPPEKYFNSHPEYFSLVNGKRIRDGQLCLSNPAVIRLLGDNLSQLMKEQPGKKYWSVSQNDCINYCECDSCRKLYEKFGKVSGAYIMMANSLAERFPDKEISTLAYQFTRQAPLNITPLKNVNIMFCSIECNRSMPLESDSRSAGFVSDMKEWEKLSDNIFIWDYVVQFKTYLCPFPNFDVLKPNIRFFREHGAKMMFQQGSGSGWSDLCELKQYLIAKLLWDPEINADSVIKVFTERYYGPASKYVLQYQQLVSKTMEASREKWNLDIYGLPSFYFKTFLTNELVEQYYDLMNNAETSVANDSLYLKRVLKTRCAVDFARLDYALNAGDQAISFIKREGKRNIPDENMAAFLDKFIKNCDLTGITNIGEEKLTIHEYCDHVKAILKLAMINNKATGKSIRSLTSFDPRYSDPGTYGLTDGIFGGRHFNSGWLGYHGEDMIVEIDLGRSDTIHRVTMNFLRDFVSWIFLPDEVKLELSSDGKEWHERVKITNVITDKRFGVEPVLHQLDFNPEEVRYIRVKALSMKVCPEWHRGSGQPSWIFCDEIIVE